MVTVRPWNAREGRRGHTWIVQDQWGNVPGICSVYEHGDGGSAEANANLIVSCVNACEGINPAAVPDLLEALDNLANCIDSNLSAYDGDDDGSLVRAIFLARSALVKATRSTASWDQDQEGR